MATTLTTDQVTPATFATAGKQATVHMVSTDPELNGTDVPVVATILADGLTPDFVASETTQRAILTAVSSQAPGNTLFDGTLTVSALTPLPSHACQEVLVQNDPTSLQDIYVGNATTQSIRLQPGQPYGARVANSNLIYVIAVAGSARVNWHAVTAG